MMNTPTQTAPGFVKSVTANQSFTYADDGRLIKSVTADGMVTIWCHYPAVGGVDLLIDNSYLDTEWSTEAPSISAPLTAKGSPLPLLAEFQYLLFENEVRPLHLALYGYTAPGNNDRTPILNTVVTLEGFTLSNLDDVLKDANTDWIPVLATGRQKALVRCQTTVETSPVAKEDSNGTALAGVTVATTTVTECRYWGAEKVQLVTTETREWNTDSGLQINLSSRTTDDAGAQVALSSEFHSLYSGRVLRRDQGAEQLRMEYDGLGRVVCEKTYANDAARNTNSERNDRALAYIETRYEENIRGTWVTRLNLAQANSLGQRTLYDGLQRAVCSELQRVPGTDVSAANFCPVQSGGRPLDYLPGGLQRSLDEPMTPAHVRDWVWSGSKEEEGAVPANATSLLRIEETLGDAHGVRLFREQNQINLKNGGVVQTSVERLPSPPRGSTTPTRSRVQTEKTFDALGRMTQLKQTSSDAVNSERLIGIDYDELDRPIRWTAPDGTVVSQAYAGMTHKVTRLAIKGSGASDQPITLGTQKLEHPGRLVQRRVGQRVYRFQHTDGRVSGIEMPDKTRLFSEVSGNGNRLTWRAETATAQGAKATTTVATFSYKPLQRAINASRSASDAEQQSSITLKGSSPQLLGTSYYSRAASDLTLNAAQHNSLLGDEYAVEYTNGSQVIAYRDRLNRRTRVRRNNLEYYYKYNAWGECEQETVLDLQTGHRLLVMHEVDAFGQENVRRYLLNGREVEVYQQAWSTSGQLESKTLTRNGVLCRSECFGYDTRERLKSWRVEEASTDGPKDTGGKAIRSQEYDYDLLSNLTVCKTLFADGSGRRQEHSYDMANPTRRIKVVTVDAPAPDNRGRTGNPLRSEALLAYDDNGNLIKDEQGRTLRYTFTGRLQSVTSKEGMLITRYEYDEQERVAVQWDEQAQQRRVLMYSGKTLCGEVWLDNDGKELKRLRLDEEAGLVVQMITGQEQQTVFTLSDPQSGLSSEYRPDNAGNAPYSSVSFTPWGECTDGAYKNLISGLGFNCMRRDPLTGVYHLGNGYRVYNPTLQVCQQPDSWSPFGAGGLNDYAYCSGDPVNLYDSDGHVMISRWGEAQMISNLDQLIRSMTPSEPPQQDTTGSLLTTIIWSGVAMLIAVAGVLLAIPTGGLSLVVAGALLVVTVVSSGLSIASVALQNSDPKLADKLGAAALGLDLASMIVPIKASIGAGVRMMRWAGSKVGRVAKRVDFLLRVYRGKLNSALNFSEKHAMSNGVRGLMWPRKVPFSEYDNIMDTSYYSIINERGAEVWMSSAGVRAEHVERLTTDIIKRNISSKNKANITILSGTHGNPLGNRGYQNHMDPQTGNWGFRDIPGHQRYEARHFYERDMQMAANYSGATSEIKVIDVANYQKIPGTDRFRPMLSGEMAGILRGEDHVIVGFCHGANDRMVRDSLGLEEVRTLIPDFLNPMDMFQPGSPPPARRVPPLP
jgi:RHS repeat-associated protein